MPRIEVKPSDAVITPVRILNVVVFPAPFTPSNPKHWNTQTPSALLAANFLKIIQFTTICFLKKHNTMQVKQENFFSKWLGKNKQDTKKLIISLSN